MELQRIRSLTEQPRVLAKPALHSYASTASFYSSNASSEDLFQDAQESLPYRSISGSSNSSRVGGSGGAEGDRVRQQKRVLFQEQTFPSSHRNAGDDNTPIILHSPSFLTIDEEDDNLPSGSITPDRPTSSLCGDSDHLRPGHASVSYGSTALGSLDIESLIASYAPLMHPAAAASVMERTASFRSSASESRENPSSKRTSTASSSTCSSSSSSLRPAPALGPLSQHMHLHYHKKTTTPPNYPALAPLSRDLPLLPNSSVHPNKLVSRKSSTASSSYTSIFSKNRRTVQKEKGGQWLSGEIPHAHPHPPAHRDGSFTRKLSNGYLMHRSASVTSQESALSEPGMTYESSSVACPVPLQRSRSDTPQHQHQYPHHLHQQTQTHPRAPPLASGSGAGPARFSASQASSSSSPRSSLSLSAQSAGAGSFRWSVDSSTSSTGTGAGSACTSHSVAFSYSDGAKYPPIQEDSSREADGQDNDGDTAADSALPRTPQQQAPDGAGLARPALLGTRRGSRHRPQASLESMDFQFEEEIGQSASVQQQQQQHQEQQIRASDFPQPPPMMSRQNSVASSYASASGSASNAEMSAPCVYRSDSISSASLGFLQTVSSAPLASTLSAHSQQRGEAHLSSDAASIRSVATSSGSLALPVHRVAPLRRTPSALGGAACELPSAPHGPELFSSSGSTGSDMLAGSFPFPQNASGYSTSPAPYQTPVMTTNPPLAPEAAPAPKQTVQTHMTYQTMSQQRVPTSYRPGSGRPAFRSGQTS